MNRSNEKEYARTLKIRDWLLLLSTTKGCRFANDTFYKKFLSEKKRKDKLEDGSAHPRACPLASLRIIEDAAHDETITDKAFLGFIHKRILVVVIVLELVVATVQPKLRQGRSSPHPRNIL